MARTAADRIETATAAFEAGFLSKAAQKRAQDELSRAYEAIRDQAHNAQIAHANATAGLDTNCDARWAFFAANEMPFDLHQVRDRHLPIFAQWAPAEAGVIVDLINLRAAIKAAPLAPAPVKPEAEVKAETIRRSIVDEMARRKAVFVEGMEIGRMFAALYPRKDKNGADLGPAASLPVTVNAHWVYGHKGAQFPRHFFYLNGKLTALQTIIAIADQLEREAA